MNALLHPRPSLVRTVLVVGALAAAVAAQSVTTFASELAAPVITSPTTATGAVGTFFSYQIVASSSPTTFGASTLPSGLSFDVAIGLISGTPTAAGIFTIGISATNATGSGTSSVTVKISGVPLTTTTIGASGTFAPSATDLANSNQLSFGSIAITSGSAAFSSTVASLVDGSMYAGQQPTNTVNSLTPTNGTVAILTFDTTLEPDGYDIARIDVYTGTGQNRAMQNYNVAWAPPGSSTYTPLFTVTNAGNPAVAELMTRTIDQASNGAPIATGVGSLRVTFLNTSTDAPESMYREIDVFAPSFAPLITSPTTASATFNSPFTYQVTAAYSPSSFGATGLPPGLSINASTGVISGTPASTMGSPFTVALSATNGVGSGSASLTLTVSKASAPVTLTDLSHSYDGTAKSASATTSPAGQPVNLSYTGPSLPPINAGSYGVLGTIAPSSNYTGSASGTLIIEPAAAEISLTNLTQSYNGTPRAASASVTPAAAGVSVTYNGSATAPTNVGTYAVVATTTNANYAGTASGTLIVADTTPPVLSMPANLIVEATSVAGAAVTFAATARDDVDGAIAVNLSPASGGVFPLGTTTVNVSAKDAAGNTTRASFTITVRDTTAPVFSALTASTTTLWPVDHKMVAITLTATTSDIVSAVTTRITDVTSNEPLNASNDGNTFEDWQITGAMTLNLRAERAGDGNNRIYTITVNATDAAGNSTTRAIAITVPRSADGSLVSSNSRSSQKSGTGF